MLKPSSSDVVSRTWSSSFSSSRFLKMRMFVCLSLIIQIASSIVNLRILGNLIAGYGCIFRICTSPFASSASFTPDLSNIMLDSSGVMNLKACAANPTITSCNLLSSEIIPFRTMGTASMMPFNAREQSPVL
uniref:Uncharacterized protein n=1 Tax=Opuntia streptacantha TaxID=393608 RepID=A0A7C8ZVV1_OPUST